jgi:hypothetical protein
VDGPVARQGVLTGVHLIGHLTTQAPRAQVFARRAASDWGWKRAGTHASKNSGAETVVCIRRDASSFCLVSDANDRPPKGRTMAAVADSDVFSDLSSSCGVESVLPAGV